MQALRDYIKEHMDVEGSTLPAFDSHTDAVDLHNPESRETLNFLLSDITDGPEAVDPVILYERVREALYGAGYSTPSSTELLDLFSEMEPDGDEVFSLVPGVFLYFSFCQDDHGYYDVLAEVVNEAELEEILSDEDVEAV